jgi:hypothetical protein
MYYESTRKVRHFCVKILTYKEAYVCTEAYNVYTAALQAPLKQSCLCVLQVGIAGCPSLFVPLLTSNRIIVVVEWGGGGSRLATWGGISSGCEYPAPPPPPHLVGSGSCIQM